MVNGVASAAPSGPVDLLLAADGLGNSIIPTEPRLTGQRVPTWNYNFGELIAWYLASMLPTADDVIILRMNAEGVEKEIIDYLTSAQDQRIKFDALFGSLGDVRKCFGRDEQNRVAGALQAMEIPFVYFTSSPASWRNALDEICRLAGR